MPSTSPINPRRKALIIGVSAYDQDPLPNAAGDARHTARALANRGFDCVVLKNAGAKEIDDALDRLRNNQGGDEICLIYFSGHGVEHHGAGYIIPQDFPFPISTGGLRQFAIPFSSLADAMSDKTGAKIIVLDACRNSPHLRPGDQSIFDTEIDRIRNEERAWDNLLIAYSTSSGDTATDGPTGGKSYFCDAFCQFVQRHDLNFDDCMREIGQAVMTATRGKQRPWYYSSLTRQIGMSDMSRFTVYNSYNAPLDTVVPLSMSAVGTSGQSKHVYVVGGIPTVFAATLDGLKAIQAPSVSANLIAATPTHDGLAMLSEDRILTVGQGSKRLSAPVTIEIPFGLFACGKYIVVHGSDGWAVYTIWRGKLVRKKARKTSWPVQAGIRLSSYSACLAGATGHIVELQIGDQVTCKNIHAFSQNVNTLVAKSAKKVLCGGDQGLLVQLDLKTGQVVADFKRPSALTLPSTRRQSLMNMLDDDRITRFLTRPDTILPEIVEHLEAAIEPNRIMCADRAPATPVIACGSNEGIIDLIDLRDGQTIQQIDTEAGRGIGLAGLRFISDHVFVTLSNNGVVRFYTANYAGPEASGPFLASNEEDKLLAEQGLD